MTNLVLKEQKGQTFLEFIFLLFIIILFSFTILRGVSTGVRDRWTALVKIITSPTSDQVNIPQ